MEVGGVTHLEDARTADHDEVLRSVHAPLVELTPVTCDHRLENACPLLKWDQERRVPGQHTQAGVETRKECETLPSSV